jgi:hypothetical protein
MGLGGLGQKFPSLILNQNLELAITIILIQLYWCTSQYLGVAGFTVHTVDQGSVKLIKL